MTIGKLNGSSVHEFAMQKHLHRKTVASAAWHLIVQKPVTKACCALRLLGKADRTAVRPFRLLEVSREASQQSHLRQLAPVGGNQREACPTCSESSSSVISPSSSSPSSSSRAATMLCVLVLGAPWTLVGLLQALPTPASRSAAWNAGPRG